METLSTEEAVQNFLNQPLALLIAKTHTCAVCRGIEDRLKAQLSKIKHVPIGIVYVDELESVRGNHMLFSVPAALVFASGKEVFRNVRFIDMVKLHNTLQSYRLNNTLR